MKFEDLFTSIDLSSQLFFAGMGDKSIYAYFRNENNGAIIKKNTRVNEKWLAPAYTSEEILLKMPPILELGDEFYLNSNKYEPKTTEERFIKRGNNDIRLIIERTEDNSDFRFTARYYLPGELGSTGI